MLMALTDEQRHKLLVQVENLKKIKTSLVKFFNKNIELSPEQYQDLMKKLGTTLNSIRTVLQSEPAASEPAAEEAIKKINEISKEVGQVGEETMESAQESFDPSLETPLCRSLLVSLDATTYIIKSLVTDGVRSTCSQEIDNNNHQKGKRKLQQPMHPHSIQKVKVNLK